MKPKGTRRVYRTAEAIEKLLADYRRQDQSARQFAIQHHIAPATFRNWVNGQLPRKSASPRWVEVIPAATPASDAPSVTVEMGEGLRLRLHAGFAAAPVAELIGLLRQS